MKKTFTLLLGLLFSGVLFSQSNVYLQINHKLGVNPFGFGTTASNNIGNDFNLTRLQYYMAEITLIHDGGMETPVTGHWILANAGIQVNDSLGSFTITNLEGVRFGIGVEQSYNHLDPSSYPMSHPLAPKAPSMHWGWNAGYRFVAMEGRAGNGLNQVFQIHALDDNYYYHDTVSTAGATIGGDLYIVLDADYEMALKDIDVSSGPITHGGFGEAIPLLQNFTSEVFSEGIFTVSREELISSDVNMTVFPNPAVNSANIHITGNALGAKIEVTDLMGKTVQHRMVPATGELTTDRLDQGLYFVNLLQNGVKVATQKLIVIN